MKQEWEVQQLQDLGLNDQDQQREESANNEEPQKNIVEIDGIEEQLN